ncbi:MAG: aldo/keto reductase [Caldilineaceae bacterium]
MNYRTLGQTGLKVSEIGLGAFPISGVQTRPDGTELGWPGTTDDESIALIHRSEELGVNLIDTAEAYGNGHSEILTGKALQGRRDRWIIATKVSPNQGIDAAQPDEAAVRRRLTEACEGSLRRLQTDAIDLYQLHAIPPDWAMPTVMQTLADLRAAGKIRWYGISTNDHTAIEKLWALGPIHILQIGYNLLERSADALLHWSKAENIGTLIRVPLARGMLTGKYSGDQAQTLDKTDIRYARFQRPETVDGLSKLPQLNFLATEQRKHAAGRAALCPRSPWCLLRHCRGQEPHAGGAKLPRRRAAAVDARRVGQGFADCRRSNAGVDLGDSRQ